MAANPLSFRQILGDDRFHYGAEIVTTRGIAEPGAPDKLVDLATALAGDPSISWVSVTDNPGGSPMLAPDHLSRLLQDADAEVVVHLTCKDLNRNGLESAAWRYAAEGIDNLLALTGDYPTTGFGGRPRPVFDLDSVGLVALLAAMNEGLEVEARGKTQKLTRTNFFIGSAVSPFKRHERELMPQYFKLARKLRCGAHWVIPQLGYDMRKFHEVRLFMDWAGLDAPIIGNVYLLTKVVAGLFNRNKIPGCVVSDVLMENVKRYAAGDDKGRGFFRELAAKQLAVFKGMGFAAGYVAGMAKPDTFFQIIETAESYAENDWKDFAREIQYPQADEFYLFERDADTGLGDGLSVNREYLEALSKPPRTEHVTVGYQLSRKVHKAAFAPGRGAYAPVRKMYQSLDGNHNGDGKPDHLALRILHKIEHASKSLAFGCKDCGDCSLPDCAYLCPNNECAKTSRNGPCGGSFDGRCEAAEKPCMWTRAYDRLKYYGEAREMLDGPAVFHDDALEGTSSWSNFYLGRDHQSEKQDGD